MKTRLPASPTVAQSPKASLWRAVCLLTALASSLAQADIGVKAGAHAGVAFRDGTDSYIGAALRLAAPSSPLTLQTTYDYVFDKTQTLTHIGANLFYEAPVTFPLKPYLGVGAKISLFTLNQESMTEDSEGNRLGLNLLAGARLPLPWVSPFVQVAQGVGEFNDLALSGGIELTLRERSGTAPPPRPMRLAVTPYFANNAFGEVQSGRLGLGMSLAFFPWERFGFELDGEMHGHFFRDRDVADLDLEDVDMNTLAALVSVSGVVRSCVSSPSFGTWCPYTTAGVGAIHAWFDATSHVPNMPSTSETQIDPALTAGIGITHQFTRRVGFRLDARYFRAFVSGKASEGGYFEDYGFLRLSPGVSVGF